LDGNNIEDIEELYNKNRAMDIEQFYIEKRDNIVCFISELRAKSPCGLSLKEPKHNQGFYNTIASAQI